MATLQKIRNRGMLIGIIIGGALFAFIAGDFIKSSTSFLRGSRNELAEIAGESISITDFQLELQKQIEVTRRMTQQSPTSEQEKRQREQLWNTKVDEIVMGNEYAELGINVSSDELSNMVYGDDMNPVIRQLFRNEAGIVDKDFVKKTLKQLMESPDGTPQKEYWLTIEKSLTSQRKLEKYNTLLNKGLSMPLAMAEKIAEIGSKKIDFNYIQLKYSNIADSTVNVSQADIKKYYDAHKDLFKQDESRRIEYIEFDVIPSVDDYKATKEYTTSLIEDFKKETKIKQFVDLNSDKKFDPYYYAKDENTNKELDQFAFTAKVGDVFGPYEKGDSYFIAKLNDVKYMADSVKVRHILVRPVNGDKKATENRADSLLNIIKKGSDFAKVARTNSADQQSAVNGGDLGWLQQRSPMVPEFIAAVFDMSNKEVRKVESPYGIHLIQVVKQSKNIKKAQLAIIEKEVIASQKTVQEQYAKARKFAGENLDQNKFQESASKQKLQRRIAELKRDSKLVNNIENSRSIIRMAFKAEEIGKLLFDGNQSAVFDLGNKFIVAVLSEINEEGYSPVNKVASRIKAEVIKDKKGEQLAAKLNSDIKGSESLTSVSQKAKAEVKSASDISFASFHIPGIGIEPNLIGAIAVGEKAKISKPIVGNQGVYVFNITNEKKDNLTKENIENIKNRIESNYMRSVMFSAVNALKENANIVDNRYKFF
ncbi:MAG: SurA N-terminal domain-containing protein [Marinifilaceae bacterium]|jgi:peptidyl-prolyl cis-trans isomerase D|nr:SurA N-terminal domain-containing protein [Marinifilaceae bacterium]